MRLLRVGWRVLRGVVSFAWFVIVTVGMGMFLAGYMAWWLLTNRDEDWKAASW